jgi:hypothetical protein
MIIGTLERVPDATVIDQLRRALISHDVDAWLTAAVDGAITVGMIAVLDGEAVVGAPPSPGMRALAQALADDCGRRLGRAVGVAVVPTSERRTLEMAGYQLTATRASVRRGQETARRFHELQVASFATPGERGPEATVDAYREVARALFVTPLFLAHPGGRSTDRLGVCPVDLYRYVGEGGRSHVMLPAFTSLATMSVFHSDEVIPYDIVSGRKLIAGLDAGVIAEQPALALVVDPGSPSVYRLPLITLPGLVRLATV